MSLDNQLLPSLSRWLAALERVIDGRNAQDATLEWFVGDDVFAPAGDPAGGGREVAQ